MRSVRAEWWRHLQQRWIALSRPADHLIFALLVPVLLSAVMALVMRPTPPSPLRVALTPGVAPQIAARLRPFAAVSSVEPSAIEEGLRKDAFDAAVLPSAPSVVSARDTWRGRQAESLVALALAGLDVPQIKAAAPIPSEVARFIPGLLALNMMALSAVIVAIPLVTARKDRFLKTLVTTPMRRGLYLSSFVGFRLVVVPAEVASFALFGSRLFAMPIAGRWVDIVLVALVGGWCFGGLALMIATYAESPEGAEALAQIGQLLLVLLGGIFFSTTGFPPWIQTIAHWLPLGILANDLRAIILDGARSSSLIGDLCWLFALGTFAILYAVFRFRWTAESSALPRHPRSGPSPVG